MTIEAMKLSDDNGRPIQESSKISSLLSSKDRDFLLSPSGSQVKISELEGKVIGLYFSANWYPPCRNFNQLLVAAYDHLKTDNSNFEVVFVSSDEDSEAFDQYHAAMPWLAVPFSDLPTKKALNHAFEVEGIPCLVILQPNGCKGDDGVTHDGVEILYRYGVGAYPFTRERVEELREEERERHEKQTVDGLLSNHDRDYLLGNHGDTKVAVGSLVGKTVGLYFSAQWCVPGVKFTPKLIAIYHKINHLLSQSNRSDSFEIVFISSDRDRPSFNSHFAAMPWLAVPFGDPTVKDLTKHFDVRGIPCLVILGPTGRTVTRQGRNLINLYQESAYPFTDARLEVLERRVGEEAKSLPASERHAGHRHELTLVSEGTGGGPFICCDCDEQGYGWAYQCLECGYEVHPRCVRAVDRS